MLVQIPWKDEYKIGVSVLDREHKALFSAYNALIRTQATPGDRSAVCRAMATVAKTAASNIREEETVMRAIGYPELETHQAEHRWFSQAVEVVQRQGDQHPEIIDNFSYSLADWIFSHVLIRDRQVGHFIADQKISPALAVGGVAVARTSQAIAKGVLRLLAGPALSGHDADLPGQPAGGGVLCLKS
jgi:hemerythrin